MSFGGGISGGWEEAWEDGRKLWRLEGTIWGCREQCEVGITEVKEIM